MKKMNPRIISLLLAIIMLLSITMTACNKAGGGTEEPTTAGEAGNTPTTDSTAPPTSEEETTGGWQMPEDEYRLPLEEGYNQITFYWSHPGVIENCDIWAWWDGKEGSGYVTL